MGTSKRDARERKELKISSPEHGSSWAHGPDELPKHILQVYVQIKMGRSCLLPLLPLPTPPHSDMFGSVFENMPGI